jgi:hypothetical protein
MRLVIHNRISMRLDHLNSDLSFLTQISLKDYILFTNVTRMQIIFRFSNTITSIFLFFLKKTIYISVIKLSIKAFSSDSVRGTKIKIVHLNTQIHMKA